MLEELEDIPMNMKPLGELLMQAFEEDTVKRLFGSKW